MSDARASDAMKQGLRGETRAKDPFAALGDKAGTHRESRQRNPMYPSRRETRIGLKWWMDTMGLIGQTELASLIGCPQSGTIGRWLSTDGKHRPSAKYLWRMLMITAWCHYADFDLDDIQTIHWDEEPISVTRKHRPARELFREGDPYGNAVKYQRPVSADTAPTFKLRKPPDPEPDAHSYARHDIAPVNPPPPSVESEAVDGGLVLRKGKRKKYKPGMYKPGKGKRRRG